MPNTRLLLVSIVLPPLLLAACTIAPSSPTGSDPEPIDMSGQMTSEDTVAAKAVAVNVEWMGKESGDADGNPHTEMTLHITGGVEKDVALGSFFGAVGGQDATERPEGSISAQNLWWAGSGDDLALFVENGKLVAKRQQVGESDEDMAKLPWETIATVDLPAGAQMNMVNGSQVTLK